MANRVTKTMAIAAGIIGIVLLVCGLGSCICGFIWLGYGGVGAHGIWSGIGLLIVGSLGVAILITKSRPVMVFFLVFCIIDLIINAIQAIIAAIVAAVIGVLQKAVEDGKCTDYNGRCHCISTVTNTSFNYECDDIGAMLAIFRGITAFAVIGIIATFTGSIIGCIGSCCDKSNDQPGVVVIQQGHPQGVVQTTTVQTNFQHPTNPAYPQNPNNPNNPAYPQNPNNPNNPAYPHDPNYPNNPPGYQVAVNP